MLGIVVELPGVRGTRPGVCGDTGRADAPRRREALVGRDARGRRVARRGQVHLGVLVEELPRGDLRPWRLVVAVQVGLGRRELRRRLRGGRRVSALLLWTIGAQEPPQVEGFQGRRVAPRAGATRSSATPGAAPAPRRRASARRAPGPSSFARVTRRLLRSGTHIVQLRERPGAPPLGARARAAAAPRRAAPRGAAARRRSARAARAASSGASGTPRARRAP